MRWFTEMMKKVTNWLEQSLLYFYFGLFSFFFGCIFSAAVLGTAGFYRPPWVIMFTVGAAVTLLYYVIHSEWFQRFKSSISTNVSQMKVTASVLLYLISFLLFFALFLYPVLRWPASVAGDWFPWDAGKYHFPKAVELFRTGSVNDLTIAYGEYPYGYEALLSFGLFISKDTSLFGWIHALIDLFFLITVWLLARRYTKIHPSIVLFLTILMLSSDGIFEFLNIWQIFYAELLTVGKNDLFLAAAVLSVILFFPFPRTWQKSEITYVPFCAAGMLAVSIKPNSLFIIAPLWLLLLMDILMNRVKSGKENKKDWGGKIFQFIAASFLLIPGFLWLARNLFISGRIFSETAMEASQWSIAANIFNPYFYRYIPKNLIAILVFTLGLLTTSIIKFKRFMWPAIILGILLIGFLFTPVTAFFLRTDIPAQIHWRFGEAMLAYVFVILLIIFEPLLIKIQHLAGRSVALRVGLDMVVSGIAIGLLIVFKDALVSKPENQFILRDQFSEPVGVDGYYSAYDYVQKNVHHSTVWVENGLPYYAYDGGYTNTVSRKQFADYIIAIKKDWFGGGGVTVPSYFPENWQQVYQVRYEDPMGIVYYHPDGSQSK